MELLIKGSKIGDHRKRFDSAIGKYRMVEMNAYLVVDCRPKKDMADRASAKIIRNENRCTLIFEEDFRYCVCQMGNEQEEQLRLAN